MYISFRVFYLRYWERLCYTSCMVREQISWVDISARIISTSQFFLHLLQAIRIWNFCCISSFRSRSSGWDWCMEYTSCTSCNRQSRIAHSDHFITFKFVVFFLSSRNLKPYTPKEQVRKAKFRQQTRQHMTYANGAKHRCAVCGRTELDDPSLEFRFCSKCNGNYEYCQDHLFTHQHVK